MGEIMDGAAQAFLKTKIMDNVQKYFYLICFCAYLRDQSSSAQSTADEEQKKNFALTDGKVSTPTENLKISKKFVDWMKNKRKISPSPTEKFPLPLKTSKSQRSSSTG